MYFSLSQSQSTCRSWVYTCKGPKCALHSKLYTQSLGTKKQTNNQTKRQRQHSRQIFTFMKGWKGLGLIPQRSHLCQGNCLKREKVNHFQKPHCSKSWSKATVLSAKYSIWQSKSWKSTKAIYPIGLGRRFILQLFFVSLPQECGSDRSALGSMAGLRPHT